MSIKLKGSSDGSVSLDAPADTSPSGSDITLTLPTSAGSANQFLKNSGIAGELEYSSMVENSSGNVGIGTSNPIGDLSVVASGGSGMEFQPEIATDTNRITNFNRSSSTYNNFRLDAAQQEFLISGSEKARLDSSGRLLVGSTSARTNFNNGTASPQIQIENVLNGNKSSIALIHNENHLSDSSAINFAKTRGGTVGDNSALNQAGDRLGTITFQGNDGTEFVQAASIAGFTDASPGNNDMPGRLVFSTTADGASSTTERMRVNANGRILMNCTATSDSGILQLRNTVGSAHCLGCGTTSTGNDTLVVFRGSCSSNGSGGSTRGSITVTSSATAYNTSSDHRLKENVTDITDGIIRVKQLQPRRFNFIVDADTTVDGFLAHEAQTVVPEAVTGTHNEVDDDGNAVMQGIDQSKLVPLLTAALQEAIAKIETLETKVAALEAA